MVPSTYIKHREASVYSHEVLMIPKEAENYRYPGALFSEDL